MLRVTMMGTLGFCNPRSRVNRTRAGFEFSWGEFAICEISQQAGRAPETRIRLMVIGFVRAARLARKMIRTGRDDPRSRGNAEKPKSQIEVMMSRLSKSF